MWPRPSPPGGGHARHRDEVGEDGGAFGFPLLDTGRRAPLAGQNGVGDCFARRSRSSVADTSVRRYTLHQAPRATARPTTGEVTALHVVRWKTAEPYVPAGHEGVVNRLLAGKAEGGVEAVSIWHGTLEPGGFAEPHVHERSIQIYVGLSGRMDVETPTGAVSIDRGDAVGSDAGTGPRRSERLGCGWCSMPTC